MNQRFFINHSPEIPDNLETLKVQSSKTLTMFSLTVPHHQARRIHKPGHSLPMLHLAPTTRNNIVAVLGEFVGTFLFLFMAFAGTQIAHTPAPNPQAAPDAAGYIRVC